MKNMLITIIITTVITAAITLITLCAIQSDDTDRLNAEWQTKLTAVEQTTAASIAELRRQSNIKQQTIDLLTLENEILRERIQELTAPEPAPTVTPTVTQNPKERLPDAITNTYRCMDYRKITNTRSEQYALQLECYNGDYGIREYKGYYCAALGSAYGRDIGDTWHVTLQCGTEFDIILADYKDDGTTDFFGHADKNYDGEDCINIIEFVVDMDYVPSYVKQAGTMSAQPYFGRLYGHGGNIVKMEYTGRVWSA